VTAAPELRGEDPDGVQFWRVQGPRATAPQIRAVMGLVSPVARVAITIGRRAPEPIGDYWSVAQYRAQQAQIARLVQL
jgi:hypothetical protein